MIKFVIIFEFSRPKILVFKNSTQCIRTKRPWKNRIKHNEIINYRTPFKSRIHEKKTESLLQFTFYTR